MLRLFILANQRPKQVPTESPLTGSDDRIQYGPQGSLTDLPPWIRVIFQIAHSLSVALARLAADSTDS